MRLPSRDTWLRLGYGGLGVASAVGWNRYLSVKAKGGAYLPPMAAASMLTFSENSGKSERDIGAAMLGFLATAQAISLKPEPRANAVAGPNPQNLERIRDVTATVGAVLDVLGKLRGTSS